MTATQPYFDGTTTDGKFTFTLIEDPLNEGDLKMEVRLNGSTTLVRTMGQIALRPVLDRRLALRLANALWGWYATEEMLQEAAEFAPNWRPYDKEEDTPW